MLDIFHLGEQWGGAGARDEADGLPGSVADPGSGAFLTF